MKRLISLLLCSAMIISFALPVFATQTSEETTCSHNWSTTSETSATCTAAGEKKMTCTVCNETKTESVSATGHSWGTPVVDDATHTQTCTVCGTVESVSHDWGNGTVVSPATCTSEGSKTYTCSCGKSKTEVLSKIEHDFNEWVITSGSHERSCKNCTNKESGTHSFKDEVIKEATCLEAGSKKQYCTVCGTSEIITVPKLTTHTYDNVCDPDCNVCSEKRSTSHSYGSSWSRDSTGHWHECTKCGDKSDFRAHYPGSPATEYAPQVCLTCDYVIAKQKEHQHNYGKKWMHDETGHWYECATCDVKKDFAGHVYDSACDVYCNVCDYKNPNAHNYGNTWEHDSKKHWAICKTCNQKTEAELHVPGAAATEDQPQLCTVCGYEIAPAQEHVHNFGMTWMYDSKSHWQACICGEQTVPAAHTWNNGIKNKDKTVTYQCTQCQAEKTEKASGLPVWVLIFFILLAIGSGTAIYFYYIFPQKREGKFSSTM